MFKLKDNDEVISVSNKMYEDTIVVTKEGYALKYSTSEIPLVGLRTSGVKSINLGSNDEVISSFNVNPDKEYITVFTDRNTAKKNKK
ncbi:MAG: hypothetical protein L6V81_11390 [Clostridium sp.]|nr:MAG: hypothetical protein L6V81_11390 [Clostridium sp.]